MIKVLLRLEGTGDKQLGAGWEEAGETQKLGATETKGQTAGV